MGLDPFTTAVIIGVAFLVLAVLALYFCLQDPRARWLGWWSGFYGLGALGVILQIPRAALLGWLTPGFANALVLAGIACGWQGARAYEGKRTFLWPAISVAIVWLGISLVPGFLGNLPLRVIASSMAATLFLGLAARELWQGRAEGLPSKRPAAVLVASLAAIFAMRIPLAYVLPFPIGGQPVTSWALAVFGLTLFVHAGFLVALLVSLSKERREAEQREIAYSDPLTGLLNRRAFAEQAPRLLQRQALTGAPLALLVLDLDHFKAINDCHGHDVGDRVLSHFAAILRSRLRPTDLSYRFGGEEFCCLLPDVTVPVARDIAERICTGLSRSVLQEKLSRVRATVSIGIASSELDGYDLDLLLAQADSALYEAKALGRSIAVVKGGGALGAAARLIAGMSGR